ncbi:MAG: hypothetical protein ACLUCU_05635 [Slackia sp.]
MAETNEPKAFLSPEKRERWGVHYLGISLILAWYYCLWFTPNVFASTPITDANVTFSWLATLLLTGIAFLAIPLCAKKVRFWEHPASRSASAWRQASPRSLSAASPRRSPRLCSP